MKKLLGILTVSLAILVGLLAYDKYGDDFFSRDSINAVAEEIENVVPIPKEIKVPEITRVPLEPKASVTEDISEGENSDVEAEEVDAADVLDDLQPDLEINENTHDALSYAYNKLSESERELYDYLYTAIVEYKEGVILPTKDIQLLDKVFNCVVMDHPEIFYIRGYRYTKYQRGDTLEKLGFTASYCYSKSEKEQIWPKIDEACDKILANVYEGASDYDKIKYIYDTIILNTDYDLDSPDNQNVISVLLNGRSVCQGYSETFQLLLNRLGIPCTLVTGYVTPTGVRHAWNVCQADGEWYYVDVTWGDASYQIIEDGEAGYVPMINHDYLLVTSAEIDQTHKTETPVSMPYTQAKTDNYYVKEGLYITEYNPDILKAIFDYRRQMGEESVALKCSDQVVFDLLERELVENKKIFDYAPNQKIKYQADESMKKLVFALQ